MSMLFDLARTRGGVDRISRHDPAEVFDLTGEEFRLVAPVDFTADVTRDGKKARLAGQMGTRVELPCSRCLEPYQTPVSASFDLLFLPATEQVGKPEGEINDEDVGVSFYTDDQIDLAEVIREQIFLSLPMKPLCREDCQGLCPVCGINRNNGSCSCQFEWVDPRMDALRRLRAEKTGQ
jgi:uncharacterized protein